MTAHAEFKDGNDLLSDINAQDAFSRGVALGYITGVSDMGMGVVHCPPSNVRAGQLLDMVKNYLTNTPAERHQTADVLVNKVMKLVWPCPAKSRGNPT
jgi:hypothetical protein